MERRGDLESQEKGNVATEAGEGQTSCLPPVDVNLDIAPTADEGSGEEDSPAHGGIAGNWKTRQRKNCNSPR